MTKDMVRVPVSGLIDRLWRGGRDALLVGRGFPDVAHGDIGPLACGPARCRPTTPCQAAERQRSCVPAGLGDCNYVDLVHAGALLVKPWRCRR
jgi:hypothetical protein